MTHLSLCLFYWLSPNWNDRLVILVLSITGDPMGLALKNIGELLRLPSRSGEQNMFDFPLVLCVLRYMRAAKHLTSDFEERVVAVLTKGTS